MTRRIEVKIVEKADWDEALHPRDDHGRFGSGGGGGGAKGTKPSEKLSEKAKANVETLMQRHFLQGKPGAKTAYYDVNSTMEALRDAYKAGSGNRSFPSTQTLADINEAHLKFAALHETPPPGATEWPESSMKDLPVANVREAMAAAYRKGEESRGGGAVAADPKPERPGGSSGPYGSRPYGKLSPAAVTPEQIRANSLPQRNPASWKLHGWKKKR